MNKKHRNSLERHNAPFRGASSREDTVNFDLAVMHDLVHIEKVSGGNAGYDGHSDYITGNLSALYHGEGTTRNTIPTAGKIVTVLGPVEGLQDLTGWTEQNGANVSAAGNGYTVENTGLLVPSGLISLIEVNPGDILQLRFKLTKLTGQGASFAFGAEDLNYDGDALEILDLSAFSSGQYIEKRLHCQSRQELKVVLYPVYQTTSGTAVTVRFDDFSLNLLHETSVGLSGTDSVMKLELEEERQRLCFLEERITEPVKGGIY